MPRTPLLLQKEFVHDRFEELEDHLERIGDTSHTTEDGDTLTPETLAGVRAGLGRERQRPGADEGTYLPRSTVGSLAQSALHAHLGEDMGDPFAPADVIGWG